MTTVRYSDFSSYDDDESVRRFTNHLRDEIAAMSRILVEHATFRDDQIVGFIEENESSATERETRDDDTDEIDAQPGTTEFLRQVTERRDDDERQRIETIRDSVGEAVFSADEISDSLDWSIEETRESLSTMVEEGILETVEDGYSAVPDPDRETGYGRLEQIVSDNLDLYPVGKRGDGNGCSPFSLIDNPTVIDTTDYVSRVEGSEFDDVSLEAPVLDSLKESVIENLRLRRVLDGTNLVEYVQIHKTTSETFSRDDVERLGWSDERVSEVLDSLVETGSVEERRDGYVWISDPEVVADGVSEEATRDWFDSNSPEDGATKWLGRRH